jgi:hypothetical protein
MPHLLRNPLKRSFGLSLLLLFSFSSASQAIQLSNGVTFFDRSPILDLAQLSNRSTDVPNAVYQFTIELPKNAGEKLKSLEFEQVENADTIQFNPNRTQVFLGSRARSQAVTPIKLTSADNRWILTFDPPIEPGKTVTVLLYARRNPSSAGTYFIGVTAFPMGENPHGQFLGFGRFRIQERRRNDD